MERNSGFITTVLYGYATVRCLSADEIEMYFLKCSTQYKVRYKNLNPSEEKTTRYARTCSRAAAIKSSGHYTGKSGLTGLSFMISSSLSARTFWSHPVHDFLSVMSAGNLHKGGAK